ncbi:Rho termination factor N-terminal domain-containing protein [Nonomuraea polychroma]|uniref:Rho termination factor N-terminal domain-containing protein n=1 Tax=Nonomuraea polychroma TaxID=46176 RepID=UPI003D8DCAFF
MSSAQIVSIVIGVIIAECTDIAPWLAKQLVRWSAQLQYLDRARAVIRAEELEAVIDSRPGKLFKLVTALLFTLQAGISWTRRAVHWWMLAREIGKGPTSAPTESDPLTEETTNLGADIADTPTRAAAKPRARRSGTGLSAKVLPELQKIAAELGVSGTGRMRKSQLITAIQEKQRETSD